MRRGIVGCVMFIMFGVFSLFANNESVAEAGGIIRGIVKEKVNDAFVEYATIAIYLQSDNSVVTGAVTNIDGEFRISKLDDGVYYAVISFLGYNSFRVNNIKIGEGEHNVNLGEILLEPSAKALKEIEVLGNRKSFEYKIDKKVINVGKQYSSASLSAIEVLENVPSVKVDIEGNVSLRGSTGFKVLIDGKPTILEPSDALQQIPANTIENIEIITNPSAKYAPDGTAGIINIITKGNKLLGLNGQLSLHTGMYNRKGSELLLNYRTSKINYSLGGDYNVSEHPGENSSERITHIDSVDNYLNSVGESGRERKRWSVNAGLEFDINEKNNISIGGRYGYRIGSNTGRVNYHSFTYLPPADSFYTGIDDRFRDGAFYSVTGNYQHLFNEDGHDLKLQVDFGQRNGDEETQSEKYDDDFVITSGQINYESGPGERTQIRLDYTLPIGEANKLEAGYQGRYSYGEDNTAVDSFDVDQQEYVRVDRYENATLYHQDITGLYGIFSGSKNNLGYQAGFRTEYTSRVITTSSDGNKYTIGDWDFFPTLHLSYQLPRNHQIMASYSRRIQRPRGWYLEPFLTWRDAFNVRKGNPDLQSEYIDSYELGYLKELEKAYIAIEGYYRQTHNKIEFIRSVYSKDIFLYQPKNIGTDNALGVEASFNYTGIEWWELNLMGDIYNYRVEGEYAGQIFDNNSFNYGVRCNNIFKLPFKSQLQFNFNYNSPSVTAQGKNHGYFQFNSAYRIDLFRRKVSAIVQARDLFSTAKRERTTSDTDFYNYTKYTRNSPMVTFTLSYRINNYKPKKETTESSDNGGGEDF